MVARGRHLRLLAGLALLLLAPLAALHGGASATADKTTITFWLDTTGGSPTANCINDNVVKAYNAQGGNITVNATLQANAWDATRTALSGGGGPDIVATPGPSFAVELAKAGQLAPLDDYASQNGWSKTFIPWALNLGKVDGKLYSIPNEVETLVLYYNKTLFQKNGWEPPKTTADLMKLAAQIKAKGIIPFAHANKEWRPANEWFVGEFLNHVAGPQKVYEALTGKAKWDDPAFAQSIDMLNQMQQSGWFMGGLDRYYTTPFNESHGALGDGTAAMDIEGTWFLSDINTFFGDKAGNSNDWDWVPVPSTNGDAIYDLGIGSTLSINKHSKNPRAAAQFLSYYFSPAVQAKLLVTCGVEPAPVTLNPADLKGLDPRAVAIRQALNQASSADKYGYTTWTFWPNATETYLIDNIEKVWAGKMTTKEYLDGMQAQFDKEVAAKAVLQIPPR